MASILIESGPVVMNGEHNVHVAPLVETAEGGRWDQGPFGGKKTFYLERTVDFTKFRMITVPPGVRIDSG
jgi:hypothetical protein